MLKPIGEECGLGCPPEPFTTNASESINAMLKRKLDYKWSELPAFIDKVKELVNKQQKELERAVIGKAKYQMKQQYQYLQVTESKWFLMTPEQRKKHLTKLESVALESNIDGDALIHYAQNCPVPQSLLFDSSLAIPMMIVL